MRLDLIRNGQVVDTIPEGGWLTLPSGLAVSPAQAGWSDGEYSLAEASPPALPSPEELLLAERAAMTLSFAQLLIGLVAEGWLTEADGEGWLAGTLPAAVLAVIDTLPNEQRFAAKARALRPSQVLRTDPLVGALGAAAGRGEVEIDAFFRTYAQV